MKKQHATGWRILLTMAFIFGAIGILLRLRNILPGIWILPAVVVVYSMLSAAVLFLEARARRRSNRG